MRPRNPVFKVLWSRLHMFQGWLRRAESTLQDGYGEKAAEDLSEEKISGLGLPRGVHSVDRGRRLFQEEEKAGRRVQGGAGAGMDMTTTHAGAEKLGPDTVGAAERS